MAALGKLGNYKNFGLFIIRAGLGIMFIYHGYPKLTGGQKMWGQLGESTKYVGIHFLPVFWGLLCALVETIGGIFLVIGFWFRPICILLLINLLVAAAAQYAQGGLGAAAHPIEDAIAFAGLLFVGPGKFSVDKK
ncbi:MAG TPA: DoxX family protein [Mucilaginibacter sp.]|jgi:putative oxidoreductase|nr:DoxX family protein [Mucilaginibacter sp.]